MANEDKRIIELPASTSILNDDWIGKDSASQGTTKIQLSLLKQLFGGNNFAGEWHSGTVYNKDTYVTHEGKLYHNIKGGSVVSVNWNSSQWQEIDVSSELKKVVGSLAPTFDSSTNYDVDDLVTFNGGLCRCISPHSAGAWNSAHFANVNVASLLTSFIMDNFTDRRWVKYSGSPVNYTKGTVIHKGLSMYRCKANTTNQSWDSSKWEQVDVTDLINSVTVLIETVLSNIAPTFSSLAQYSINDFVLYNNQLYICMKPHHGSWDPLDFGTGKIGDILKGIFNNIADVYNPSGSYVKGDVVNYVGIPLRCIVDTATSPMVVSEWEQVTVDQLIDEKVTDVQIAGQTTVDENKISDLTSLAIEGTASGEIASFSDGSNLPMRSFICDIDPVQDLQGFDAPWVGGAGKNKLPMTVDEIKTANGGANTWTNNEKTISGITFSILTDNNGEIIGVNANGTATADAVVTILVDTSKVYGDSYFVGCNGGSNNTYNALMWDATTNARAKKWDGTTASTNSIDGTFQQVKIVQGNNVKFQLRVMNGQTVNNVIFQPMICLATETDPTFAPYSNICPISGHTGVDANISGANLWDFESYLQAVKENYPDLEWSKSNNEYSVNRNTYLHNYGKWEFSKKDIDVTISIKAKGTNGGKDVYILAYDQNDNEVTRTRIFTNDSTFTQGSISCKCSKVVLSYSDGGGMIYAEPQINVGLTLANYTPFVANNLYSVSWQTEAGEVFGGYVDLVSGELTVTDGYVDLGTLSWIYDGDGVFRTTTLNGSKLDGKSICSNYTQVTASWVNVTNGKYRIAPNAMRICDTNYTDATAFTTAMNGVQLVYELATPITYQLTPTQIKSLLGNNNAWCSTGDVNVKYNKDATIVINSLIARIEALENA